MSDHGGMHRKKRQSFKSKEPYIPFYDHQNRRKVGYRLWRDQHGKCYWCGGQVLWCAPKGADESATIDHLRPLSRGGTDEVENWVLSCHRCNHDRGNTLPPPKTRRRNAVPT